MRPFAPAGAPGHHGHVTTDPPLPAADPTWSPEERAWVERDNSLRARARALAARWGRDEEDVYRAMRQLARTPEERLRLGLRHGRLHPQRRGTTPSP